MLRVIRCFFIVLFCAAFYSCATLLNGSTQDVLIVAPMGTSVIDTNGMSIQMLRYDFNQNFIKLKRNRNYVLRFKNEDQEIQTKVPRSIGGGWIVADIILDVVPILVDWWTEDWYSFDNLKIHFASDTTKNKIPDSYVESYEPVIPSRFDTIPKIGGIFFFGAGAALPINDIPLFFNGYEMGLGYTLFPKLELILSGTAAFDVALPAHSDHGSNSTSIGCSLEARYNLPSGIYGNTGGGWALIKSDSIKYSDPSVPPYNFTLAPVNKSMGTMFIGIGYSGTLGFIELRHTFGLSKIQFSNGETSSFNMTALNFGLNVHF